MAELWLNYVKLLAGAVVLLSKPLFGPGETPQTICVDVVQMFLQSGAFEDEDEPTKTKTKVHFHGSQPVGIWLELDLRMK